MRPSSYCSFSLSVTSFLVYSIHLMSVPVALSFLPQRSPYCARTFFVQTNQTQRRRASGGLWNQVTSSILSAKEEVDPGVVAGLEIVKYPHPALRAENDEITLEELKNDDKESPDSVHKLAKNMLKLMYKAEGVGLAAPQVGVNKRLMVYNPTGDSSKWLEETILVNPKIVEYSDAKDDEIEGCLSFPNMSGEVERSKWIKVEAMNLRGKTLKKKFSGWEARIFQHEYDHLDGKVYIDRLSEETRAKVQPRLDELIKAYGEGGAV